MPQSDDVSVGSESESGHIEATKSETFGISYTDDSVRQIISDVAEIFELNIVMPPDLQGETSLRLRNVTWPRVFDIVLDEFGYTYRIDDNIIFIERRGIDEVTEDVDEVVDPRVVVNEEGLLNLSFDELTPIREIASLIADVAGINLSPLPRTLHGETEFQYRGVSWQEAFEDVLEEAIDAEGNPVPHTFIEDGRRVRILVQREDRAHPVTIFQIRYGGLAVLRELVEESLGTDDRNRVRVDSRSNSLIVQASRDDLERVKSLITELDQPVQQVLIETKFVEIGSEDMRNVGLDWSFLDGYSVSAGGLERQWERIRGQERETGRDREGEFEDLFDREIEDTIEEGILETTETTSRTSLESTTLTTLSSLLSSGSTTRTDTASFSASDIRLILNLMEAQGGARIVSAPTTMVINGQTSTIERSRNDWRRGETNFVGEAARPEFGPPQEIDGDQRLLLEVTPTISGGTGDLIQLAILANKTDPAGNRVIDGQELPLRVENVIETNVAVRNNETFVMGGIDNTLERENEQKVPFLGDIPLIGRAFRNSSRSKDRNQLFIFLTASTVDPYLHNYTDHIDERRLSEAGLSHREIQGFAYRRSDEEEELLREYSRIRSQLESQEFQSPIRERVENLRGNLPEDQPEYDSPGSGRIILDRTPPTQSPSGARASEEARVRELLEEPRAEQDDVEQLLRERGLTREDLIRMLEEQPASGEGDPDQDVP
ncbi:MAG: secretin and TonB N-terminal domain-containing protein [Opitutales bacterium]|nr:secretin and TonB N-terminal domain-containing protein [Opitutales bacterium]MCH8539903.1 secretin and TonB N-terminal domain-containing protein [Opitutales bacterium]